MFHVGLFELKYTSLAHVMPFDFWLGKRYARKKEIILKAHLCVPLPIDLCLHLSNFFCMQVNEVKSSLSQIDFDVEIIHQMVSGLVSR